MQSSHRGLVQGTLAYGLWGLVAAYWKLLRHVSPLSEPLAHDRLLAFVWIRAGLVAFSIDLARLPSAARSPAT